MRACCNSAPSRIVCALRATRSRYNYNYDLLDKFHAHDPEKPLISSESCSCTSDRAPEVNATRGLLGALNAWSCIRDCWQPIAERDFVMGSFDWTGFDYRGEPTPTSWPVISSHFGVLDLAGFYKARFAQ